MSSKPSLPYVPASAPFTNEQRAWLNGYLAGLFCRTDAATAASSSSAGSVSPRGSLLVLYGTQTGTAEALAKRIGAEAGNRNWTVRVVEMARFAEIDFTKETQALLVTSTWGDGDPPDNAVTFWNHLNSAEAPKLAHLSFAVLALGDRNYTSFCGAGRKFDERLEQLGGKRICARAECDTDYEQTAADWLKKLWQILDNGAQAPSPEDGVSASTRSATSATTSRPGYSKSNPFFAPLLASRNLNGTGSSKETHHLEFSLAGSGLTYEPGDALGIFPCNCPDLISKILDTGGWDGEEAVPDSTGHETSLRNALSKHYQITSVPVPLLEAIASGTTEPKFQALLQPDKKTELDQYLYGRDLLDLLQERPGFFTDPKDLVKLLRKLQQRLYSISSSPRAHPDQVHITVGALRYESHGRSRKGVCSIHLAERLSVGATTPLFIQPSHGFKLPTDPTKPIIMVGPGTGIAPFRAFLEERQVTGATGKNWLFFGDQHSSTDFLYQAELDKMVADGHLSRLDTAFSRDQAEKIYVQQRMLENGQQLCAWLEEGAHFYVCGDARRIAKDVDAALHQVIQKELGKSAEQAAEYVAGLKSAKRYQRDVY